MEFPEHYFQKEIREGFEIEEMMKRAWAAEMEVLSVIDRICKRHGITYFAGWGTLLGAIRHEGFIPWDDDIDLFMKREDYKRFCEVCRNEEEMEGCVLRNMHTRKRYDRFHGLFTNGKYSTEPEHLERYHGCPYWVGIDIYPLDYIPEGEEAKMQLGIESILFHTLGLIKFAQKEGNDAQVEQLVQQVENLCGTTLPRKNITNEVMCLAEGIAALYHPWECKKLMSITGGPIEEDVEFDKEWFAETVSVPFEHIRIPVPKEYDKVLTAMYGEWRIPVQGEASHDYPFYKAQEEEIKRLTN